MQLTGKCETWRPWPPGRGTVLLPLRLPAGPGAVSWLFPFSACRSAGWLVARNIRFGELFKND